MTRRITSTSTSTTGSSTTATAALACAYLAATVGVGSLPTLASGGGVKSHAGLHDYDLSDGGDGHEVHRGARGTHALPLKPGHSRRQHTAAGSSRPGTLLYSLLESRLPDSEEFEGHAACRTCTASEIHVVRRWYRDGIVIARGLLDEEVLSELQTAFEEIVSDYAIKLEAKGKISRPASDYFPRRPSSSSSNGSSSSSSSSSNRQGGKFSFSEVYSELYRDNLEQNGGGKSDLPTYFRSETHRSEVYSFLMHERLRRLTSCMLQADALRLYPVYMMRGKVPDKLNGGSMTVDWHQDAEYTYYWYSDLNTTVADMDAYAGSIVNTWVPVTDVPVELGPVQLMHKSSQHLTRADMLCKGEGCSPEEKVLAESIEQLGGGSFKGERRLRQRRRSLHESSSSEKEANKDKKKEKKKDKKHEPHGSVVEYLRVVSPLWQKQANKHTLRRATFVGSFFFFFSEPPSFGTSYLTDQSIKHDIDRRIAERPDLLETANMKRGDVLFFNQYVYHRGKCKKFVCLLELAFLCFHR